MTSDYNGRQCSDELKATNHLSSGGWANTRCSHLPTLTLTDTRIFSIENPTLLEIHP